MVFWIGTLLVALTVAAATGWRLMGRTAKPAWPAAAGFVLASVAAFAAAVQTTIASLEEPARPAAQAAAGPHGAGGGEAPADSFEGLVAKLETALDANPDDPERWALLGRSYLALDRLAEAVDAFQEAVDRTDPPNPDLIGELGQAQIAAADGRVAGAPEATFALVLTLRPDDPRARYFLANAKAEKGDLDGARADLTALLQSAPQDAPWRATVFERLQELEPRPAAPQPPAAQSEGAAPGPTPEQVAAAQAMSPEEREEMIRGMVDGLAEKMKQNPDDFRGWLRLANAYMVLDRQGEAADALEAALLLQPANVGLLIQYAEVRIAADDGRIGPDALRALQRANDRQPGTPQVLWRLGQAAAVRGETEDARRMWTEILPKLLESDPLKAEVRAALESL